MDILPINHYYYYYYYYLIHIEIIRVRKGMCFKLCAANKRTSDFRFHTDAI